MNILIVVEVDWIKKVTFEMHHLSELFSLMGHKVFAFDLPDSDFNNFSKKIKGEIIENYHRVYDDASITLIRPPIIPLKGINRIIAYITSYKQIKTILKKFQIDCVLHYSIVTYMSQTIKACQEANVPVVNRTFDVVHDLMREKYMTRFVKKKERDLYSKINRVIANTKFMKDWAIKFGAKKEIVTVIPQGVDNEIMKYLPRNEKLAAELHIKSDDKVIMYLGSIEEFSGLDELLKNFSRIKNVIPKLKLLVVGGGSFLKKLQKLSSQYNIENDIIFTGFKPYKEIPQYCSLSLLCVNTFRITDMTDKLSPVKIFDLQSCGKPILATPLQGSLLDFPEKEAGVIYEDLEKFPEKIIELLKDQEKLKEIGFRGKEYVEKNFTWKIVAEKMIDELMKAKTT